MPYSIVAVDFLHEIELGLVKNTLVHIFRVFEHFSNFNSDVVNERFRKVGIFGASTIRQFASNVSEMKKLAARDFEDILQCSLPCFSGILEEPYNSAVLDVVYTILDWHCMAKLRIHTDSTLNILDELTTHLGIQLRAFKELTADLDIKETKKEYLARRKRDVARAARAGLDEPPESARKSRTLNLNTPKMHAPGDYVEQIRYFGPIDNHSTQAGEHEHRRSKARYKRVSKRDFTSQLVKLDVKEAELLRMDEELRAAGVMVPSVKAHPTQFADDRSFDPSFHHNIASNQHNPIFLQDWVTEHEGDPAMTTFVSDLRKYLLAHVRNDNRALEDLNYSNEDLGSISILNDKIYSHQTLRVNYTTYDVRRDQDVINPSGDKRFVMVRSQADEQETEEDSFNLYWFAEVLGIYHTNVLSFTSGETEKVEFLWVQWMGNKPDNNPGAKGRRLMKIGYVPNVEDQIPFGFLDPAHVVRGCHLIPDFQAGRTRDLLEHSFKQHEDGDWVNFYVNEFVDRDMRMRFLQLGVGHVGYRRTHELDIADDESETEDTITQHHDNDGLNNAMPLNNEETLLQETREIEDDNQYSDDEEENARVSEEDDTDEEDEDNIDALYVD